MTDTPQAAPYSLRIDLGALPNAGAEIHIAPSAEERSRLAAWAGVDAIQSLDAAIEIQKLSPVRFRYAARFTADVVQSCVVTLVPVRSRIERHFERDLRWVRPGRGKDGPLPTVDIVPDGEDGEDILDSPRFDAAGPILEELVLAIDPYPRAAGIHFEPPKAEDDCVSPFAALEKLKGQGRS